MSETEFKPGDVVFHKVNNLRMVVTNVYNDGVTCTYLNHSNSFATGDFKACELSAKSINDNHIYSLAR